MNRAPRPSSTQPPRLGELLVSARSFAEYLAMFELTAAGLTDRRVLDCPGGAASFTVGAAEAGATAIAVDPAYARQHDELVEHAAAEAERGNDHIRADPDGFVWSFFTSPDDHLRSRLGAIERFDQDRRRVPERYLAAALPQLPFTDDAFDLAVSSHLLFTYDDRFDEGFHVAAATELLRVASEVRLFPILSLRYETSPYAPRVVAALQAAGARVDRIATSYRLQRGADEMLVARR